VAAAEEAPGAVLPRAVNVRDERVRSGLWLSAPRCFLLDLTRPSHALVGLGETFQRAYNGQVLFLC